MLLAFPGHADRWAHATGWRPPRYSVADAPQGGDSGDVAVPSRQLGRVHKAERRSEAPEPKAKKSNRVALNRLMGERMLWMVAPREALPMSVALLAKMSEVLVDSPEAWSEVGCS